MNMPHDSIARVELEGDRGVITETKA